MKKNLTAIIAIVLLVAATSCGENSRRRQPARTNSEKTVVAEPEKTTPQVKPEPIQEDPGREGNYSIVGNLYLVYDKLNQGVKDDEGRVVIEKIYKKIEFNEELNVLEVSNGDKFGYFDLKGNQIFPFILNKPVSNYKDVMVGRSDDGAFFITREWKVKNEGLYFQEYRSNGHYSDETEELLYEFFNIYTKDGSGITDGEGNVLVKPIYKEVEKFDDCFIAKNAEKSFIISNGQTIEHNFDEIMYWKKGFVLGKRFMAWFIFDFVNKKEIKLPHNEEPVVAKNFIGIADPNKMEGEGWPRLYDIINDQGKVLFTDVESGIGILRERVSENELAKHDADEMILIAKSNNPFLIDKNGKKIKNIDWFAINLGDKNYISYGSKPNASKAECQTQIERQGFDGEIIFN